MWACEIIVERHGMVDPPGCKFGQYHPPRAEVKNAWSYVSSSLRLLYGVDRATLRVPGRNHYQLDIDGYGEWYRYIVR
jgi:hypothetical protein